MFVDEKIAMLERYRRQAQREEEHDGEEAAENEEPLTLEEALLGLEAGELKLKDGTCLNFEVRTYFEQEIPVPLLANFYQASEEGEETVLFVNHDHEISQVVSWLRENIKTITMKQWANLLVNGMAQSGLYAKVVNSVQLNCMEYLCYEVPSKRGWVYNIMFRMKGNDKRFTGNFNCLKEEADSYGMVLEAMVHKIDEWFQERR